MKAFRFAPALLLAASVATHAQTPQPSQYVSATVTSTQADFSDVDASSGYVLSAGYNIPSSNWGAEVSLLKLGEADVDGLLRQTLDVNGYRGLITFNSNFDTSTPMNIYLKGGVYQLEVDASGEFNETASSSGFVYSVGLEFYVAPTIALGGDLTSYTGVDYVADDEDATSLGLSARFMF